VFELTKYILQTFGLTKQYGKNIAVNNVNMKIKREIYMVSLEETALAKQQ
jgi:ABC-type multidrug transport system ATPase subunit